MSEHGLMKKMAAVVHIFAAPPFGGAGVAPFPADT
jgi:hypothetical protein